MKDQDLSSNSYLYYRKLDEVQTAKMIEVSSQPPQYRANQIEKGV